MADLISDVVEQQAFDQVEKLQKGLNTLLATFNQLAGQNISFGGGSSGVSTAYVQALSELDKVKNKIVQTTERLSQAYLDEEAYLKRLQATQKEQSALNMAAAGSIDAMKARMKELERQINATADAQGKGAVTIQNLAKEYNNLNSQVSKHEQAMGNFKRNVGNYASAYNGMSIAISQVAREMPNFAQSVQIGVMSLTNNIGGLVDGYKGLIAENARLAAAGEATIPVWRGIASAVFSWNTLIMVGVTALTLFLPKLTEANKAQEDMAKKAEESKRKMIDLNAEISKEIVTAEKLYHVATNTALSYKQRSVAVQELQDKYPSYFANIDKEIILAGKAKTAYDELSQSLKQAAIYHSLTVQAEEIGKPLGSLLVQLDKVDKELLKRGYDKNTQYTLAGDIVNNLKRTRDNIQAEIDGIQKKLGDLFALSDKYAPNMEKYKKPKDKAEKGQVSEFDALMNEYKRKKTEIETEFKNPKDGVGMTLEEYYLKTMEMAHGYINKIAGVTTKTEAEREKAKTALTDVTNDIADYFAKIKDHAKLVEINPMDEIAANYFKEFGTNIGGSYSSENKRQDILTKSAEETAKRWLDDAKDKMKMAVEKWQKEQDEKGKKIEAQGSIILSGLNISTTAVQAAETHIQRLTDAQLTSIDLREQAELDSLERIKMSEKDRTEKRIAIELKYKAQKDKIHHDEVQQLRRMALLQKGIDLAKIATNMWLNITKHSGQPWAIAADIALGAAATAAVIAQPIPQYAKGTDNHKGGAAIVGEEGTELGILPDGKKFLTKNKPTLMNLPPKTKIIPHDQLIQSIYHNALIRMSEMGGVSSTDGMQEALIASVMDLKGEMHEMKNAILEKDMTVKLYGDVTKYAHLQRQLR